VSTEFAKPYNYKVEWTETTGPSSYTAGGFQIQLTRLKSIKIAIVDIEQPDHDNYVYKKETSVSGNVITVVIKRIDVTASSPASWTEPAGVDLSDLKIKVIAIGE